MTASPSHTSVPSQGAGACPEVLARVAMAAGAVPAGLDPETCARLLHAELSARGFGRAEVLALAASLIAHVSDDLSLAEGTARRAGL